MKKNSTKVYDIDPRKIDIIKNFNKRVDFGDIDELAAQIKEQGLLEPITVIPYETEDTKETRYFLMNGERRYRALMKLIENGEEISTVGAHFLDMKKDELTDADLYVQQYMRNEGKRFNDVEFGYVCQALKNQGLSNSEIAKKLGKNPGVITYALQSLDYDPRIKEMIEKGEIGGTEVRRMYTAYRKKYGDEWEEKANEAILAMKVNQAEKADKTDKPAKVSIKSNDLYGDVKDTKTFYAGMKIFKQYVDFFRRSNPGVSVKLNIFEMFDNLSKNSEMTLRDLFDKAFTEYKQQA